MLIAKEKRKTNIAEYIIYMWQLEDIIRAYNFNIQDIETNIINKYNVSGVLKSEISDWYKSMVESMIDQKIEKNGHLNYLNGIIQELSELNIKLIQSNQDMQYSRAFNEALPAISEIIKKSNGKIKNEIDACLTGLYGILTLKLKKQEVSDATLNAQKSFSKLMALLASKYKLYENGELNIE